MRAPACVAADAPRGDHRHARGRHGEQLAASYLRDGGYRLLEANFRNRLGELDIIAVRGTTVAFVEVKTRSNRRFGEPFEAVTAAKQSRLRRMAQVWLSQADNHRYRTRFDLRFDVISIVIGADGNPLELEHMVDAFR